MKRLKFRAYYKKLKKMFNVHSLLWSGDRLCWAVLSDEKGLLYNDGEEVEIEYLEILQFTDLCDKKEKGGYHKDICRIPKDHAWALFRQKEPVNAVIEWDRGCFYLMYSLNGVDRYCSIENLKYSEIIGNVFQNKDLLEKKP